MGPAQKEPEEDEKYILRECLVRTFEYFYGAAVMSKEGSEMTECWNAIVMALMDSDPDCLVNKNLSIAMHKGAKRFLKDHSKELGH